MCIRLMQKAGLSKHIFPGLHTLLPREDSFAIWEMRPHETESDADKQFAYKCMQDYFLKHKERLFGPDAVCRHCVNHPGEDCPIRFQPPPDVPPHLRPRSVSFSSPMCTPWSTHGLQLGAADESMESFYQYMAMLAASDHDLCFIEQAFQFDWSLFETGVTPKFKAIRVKFGNSDRTLCIVGVVAALCKWVPHPRGVVPAASLPHPIPNSRSFSPNSPLRPRPGPFLQSFQFFS